MKRYILFTALLILANCKDAKKSDIVPITSTDSSNEIRILYQKYPGKKILENECYICHNPKSARTHIIAPPMIAIKMHYIDSSTTREEFTNALINWVNDPEQAAKMPGAHKRFGSMPYMPHPNEIINLVAEYLYDNDVDRPEWFDSNFEQQYKKEMAQGKGFYQEWKSPEFLSSYTSKGLQYAKATQTLLGKKLVNAIREKGTTGAIGFCNIVAIKLTDSLSVMKNAIIKRVTDKPRNTVNLATIKELGYIRAYKEMVSAGVETEPIVQIENGEVYFYSPIFTNTICLQCHGKPNEQITQETLARIKNLYPTDKAVGYNVNEVRGLWAINFDEDK